jgi:uncharacterized protein YndB with AHSA1/START domain
MADARATHTTRATQHVNAPPAAVYCALLDAGAVQQWMVPDDMTSEVHAFDARVGGAIRVSLTYTSPGQAGKSSAHTDTYHGTFLDLVADQRVVETTEFETADPAMQGVSTVTYELVATDRGTTNVHATHADVPPGVDPADNELGWRMSLGKLATFVQTHAAAR